MSSQRNLYFRPEAIFFYGSCLGYYFVFECADSIVWSYEARVDELTKIIHNFISCR